MLSPLNADYKIPVLTLALCSSTASSAPRPEKVVEFFLERDAAEAMICEVREDEPMLAEGLRIEAIELG